MLFRSREGTARTAPQRRGEFFILGLCTLHELHADIGDGIHKFCTSALNAGSQCSGLPRLFTDLELAHGDGSFPRLFRTLTKVDLLILDDWGPDRLTGPQRRDLLEIVEERYGRGSMLITSQLTVDAWHEIIAEPTFADAILDRLVHNAYRLTLDGPSMRKLKAEEAMAETQAGDSAKITATKQAKGGKE